MSLTSFDFNGLGSKGTLHAPFFASHFVRVLSGEMPLDPEVDLNRKTDLHGCRPWVVGQIDEAPSVARPESSVQTEDSGRATQTDPQPAPDRASSRDHPTVSLGNFLNQAVAAEQAEQAEQAGERNSTSVAHPVSSADQSFAARDNE